MLTVSYISLIIVGFNADNIENMVHLSKLITYLSMFIVYLSIYLRLVFYLCLLSTYLTILSHYISKFFFCLSLSIYISMQAYLYIFRSLAIYLMSSIGNHRQNISCFLIKYLLALAKHIFPVCLSTSRYLFHHDHIYVDINISAPFRFYALNIIIINSAKQWATITKK